MTSTKTPVIDIYYDDGERIEIESSHSTIEEGIAALHSDPRYSDI